jgi:hypothetical protein
MFVPAQQWRKRSINHIKAEKQGNAMSLNHFAVFVAALAHWGIGALWYSVIFQKPWMKALGITKQKIAAQQKNTNMVMTMGIGFLSTWMLAYVLAYLLMVSNVAALSHVILLALLLWLGFIVTTNINSVLYEEKPTFVYWLHMGYQLVGILVASLILFYWR